MAKFCPECGSPVQPTQRFCTECGQAVSAPDNLGRPNAPVSAPVTNVSIARASQAAPADVGSAASAPKSPSRSRLPVPAGVLAVVLVLGTGVLLYLMRHQTGQPAGPAPLPALPSPPGATQPPAQLPAPPVPVENKHVTAKDGQCGLFTKAELTQVLGVMFTHATEDTTGCTYKGDAPREWVRVEILWTGGRAAVQQRAAVFESLMKGKPKDWIPPFQPVPGLGDQAFVNLVNAVQVEKGDIAFTLDLRYFHELTDPKALIPDSTRLLVNRALARL